MVGVCVPCPVRLPATADYSGQHDWVQRFPKEPPRKRLQRLPDGQSSSELQLPMDVPTS